MCSSSESEAAASLEGRGSSTSASAPEDRALSLGRSFGDLAEPGLRTSTVSAVVGFLALALGVALDFSFSFTIG